MRGGSYEKVIFFYQIDHMQRVPTLMLSTVGTLALPNGASGKCDLQAWAVEGSGRAKLKPALQAYSS